MSSQTFSQDTTLPALVEWFNNQPANERAIGTSEMYIIRVKAYSRVEGNEPTTYFIISPTEGDINTGDVYLGESVFLWIGARGTGLTCTEADWFELSKHVNSEGAVGGVNIMPFFGRISLPLSQTIQYVYYIQPQFGQGVTRAYLTDSSLTPQDGGIFLSCDIPDVFAAGYAISATTSTQPTITYKALNGQGDKTIQLTGYNSAHITWSLLPTVQTADGSIVTVLSLQDVGSGSPRPVKLVSVTIVNNDFDNAIIEELRTYSGVETDNMSLSSSGNYVMHRYYVDSPTPLMVVDIINLSDPTLDIINTEFPGLNSAEYDDFSMLASDWITNAVGEDILVWVESTSSPIARKIHFNKVTTLAGTQIVGTAVRTALDIAPVSHAPTDATYYMMFPSPDRKSVLIFGAGNVGNSIFFKLIDGTNLEPSTEVWIDRDLPQLIAWSPYSDFVLIGTSKTEITKFFLDSSEEPVNPNGWNGVYWSPEMGAGYLIPVITTTTIADAGCVIDDY